jgi:hypothetical protein
VRRDVRCWSLGRLAVDDAVRRDLSGPAVTIEFDCKSKTVVAHAGILVDPAVATFVCGIFVDVSGLAALNGLVVTGVERSRRLSRQQSRSS